MIVSRADNVPSTRDEGVRCRRVRRMRVAVLAACVALLIVSCTSTTATSAAKEAALKSIDPKAFQAVVDAAAEKLKVPG
ncbi:MAG TPA: D-alanyl-D-alanine carboxypeptidase, partial [Mycobacterium sp.]|nr:D-alanyl-D-alanine carboxypeptidase [Mycobacterium sp.]